MQRDDLIQEIIKVKTCSELSHLTARYPDRKQDLYELVCQPEIFKRLVRNSNDLARLIFTFEEHKEDLFQLLCEPENFARLVENSNALSNLTNTFKEHKEDLFQLLCEPKNFKRLVKYLSDMNNLSFHFPGHDSIFKQPTVEKAYSIVLMESKPDKAFTLGATYGVLFVENSRELPDEVISQISRELTRKDGGRLAQTHKHANQIAKENETDEKSKSNNRKG